MANPGPEQASSDRHLQLAVLALQLRFISPESLVAALSAWANEHSRSLIDILIEQGALKAGDRDVLEPLLSEHISRVERSPFKKPSTAGAPATVREGADPKRDPVEEAHGHPTVTEGADGNGQRSKPAAAEPPPTSAVPRFRELRRHARGGLGDVFVAQDEELHREVAVKRIRERHADDQVSRARFVLEAEVTGGLEHPGIVPVYALGRDADGRPYYAMRFVRGESLADVVRGFHDPKKAEARPGDRAVEFHKLLSRFVEVCNTVAYAHSRGVIHRDIKPGNIMLGQYGETLLLDWGLAKVAANTAPQPGDEAGYELEPPSGGAWALRPPSTRSGTPTVIGAAIGTPAFMSPEQAAGKIDQLGPASDIYSLGATLYAILTGLAPFEGADNSDTLRRVRSGVFAPPRARRPDVPRPLEAICLKAMAARPQERYVSAQALADDVEHWLADKPVSAFAEPLGYRLQRWLGRHRSWLFAGAAVGLLAIAGLTATVIALGAANGRELEARRQAARERDEAVRERQRALASEEKARAEGRAAAKSAEETRAVLDFFQKTVLSAARPQGEDGGLGRDATVRAAVEAAEPLIARAFGGQPAAEARVRQALGETYLYLGEPKRAVIQLERGRSLLEAKFGKNHRDTLQAANTLAAAYQVVGRWREAIALFEETLRRRREALGSEDPDTLEGMSNLVVAYRAAGRPADAIRLGEEALRLRRAKLGESSPQTLITMNNLAKAYQCAGRLDEAIALHQRALALKRATLGPTHPTTLASMNNLAAAYQDAGRWADAIPLLEQTLEAQRPKLGADHPHTAQTMTNLAVAYGAVGRPAEAVRLLEEALPKLKSRFGPDHPEVLSAAGHLGTAYLDTGQADKAVPLLEDTVKRMRARPSPEHPNTVAVQVILARAYAERGRFPEAAALAEQALASQKNHPSSGGASAVETKRVLASAYLGTKQYAAAESLLTEAIGRADAPPGTAPLVGADLQADLGDCLLRQGRAADAEPPLRRSLAAREPLQPDSWATARVRALLGQALLDQKKYADAEPLLLTAFDELSRSQGRMPASARAILKQAGQRLVQLYDAWGRKDLAESWRKKLAQGAAETGGR